MKRRSGEKAKHKGGERDEEVNDAWANEKGCKRMKQTNREEKEEGKKEEMQGRERNRRERTN